jgi:ubiquinone/menaquinone biosynthesis C-methylase UbiE
VRDERVVTTRETYDRIASDYAAANRDLPDTVRASLARFLGGLRPGAVVADVGCGPGRDLAALRAAGVRAFGFDLSAGMLRAGGLPDAVQADMTALPIRASSLDGLWCAAAFLHIPSTSAEAVLLDFARVVRPGGLLHLSVTEGQGSGMEPRGYGTVAARLFVHHDEGELVPMLTKVGFEVTSVERSESHRKWLTLGAVRVDVH